MNPQLQQIKDKVDGLKLKQGTDKTDLITEIENDLKVLKESFAKDNITLTEDETAAIEEIEKILISSKEELADLKGKVSTKASAQVDAVDANTDAEKLINKSTDAITEAEVTDLFLNNGNKSVDDLDEATQAKLVDAFALTNCVPKVMKYILKKSMVDPTKPATSKIDMTTLNGYLNDPAYSRGSPTQLKSTMETNSVIKSEMSAVDILLMQKMFDPSSKLGKSLREGPLQETMNIYSPATIRAYAESVNKTATGDAEQSILTKGLHTGGEVATKARSRVKENPWKTGGIAVAGVGLLWGLSEMFGGDDEEDEEEEDDDKEKKPLRKRALGFLGKALLVVGGAVGLGYLGKYIIDSLVTGDIKTPFDSTPSTTDSKEDQTKKYNEAPEAEKTSFEELGTQINAQYGDLYKKELAAGWESDVILGDVAGTQLPEGVDAVTGADVPADENSLENKGMVPWIIDKNYDSVDLFLTQAATVWQGLNADITLLQDKLLVQIPRVGSYLADEPVQKQKDLNLFYRQYIITMQYFQDKKQQLRENVTIEKLKAEGYDGDTWESLSDDEKALLSAEEIKTKEYENNKTLIEDALDDETWTTTNVEPTVTSVFATKKMVDVQKELETQGIDDATTSLETAETIAVLDNERDIIFKAEEEGGVETNAFTRAEASLATGTLGDTAKEELTTVCTDLVADIEGDGQGFYDAYFQPIYEAFNISESADKESFLANTGLELVPKQYIDTFTSYKTKLAATPPTLTAADLKTFKDSANAFTAFKKELALATMTISRVKSDDPNFPLTAAQALVNVCTNGYNSLVDIVKGDGESEDWGHLGIMAVATGGSLFLYGKLTGKKRAKTIGKWICLAGGAIGIAPLGVPALTIYGVKKGADWYRNGMGAYDGERGKRKMLFDLMDGKNIDANVRIAERLKRGKNSNGVWVKDPIESRKRLLKILFADPKVGFVCRDADDIDKIAKYRDNENIRVLLFTPDDTKDRVLKRKNKLRLKGHRNTSFDLQSTVLSNIREIEKKVIDLKVDLKGKNAAEVIENMLKNFSGDVTQLNKLEKLCAMTEFTDALKAKDLTGVDIDGLAKKLLVEAEALTDMSDISKVTAAVTNYVPTTPNTPNTPSVDVIDRTKRTPDQIDFSNKIKEDFATKESALARKTDEVIQNQMDALEKLEKKVGDLPPADCKLMKTLFDTGFEPTRLLQLHSIKGTHPNVFIDATTGVDKSIDDVITGLKALGGKEKAIGESLEQITKKAVAQGDEILALLKTGGKVADVFTDALKGLGKIL